MGLKDKTIIDLTGQKFGKLTVLKLDHIEKSKKYWLCKCDCGKEKIVNGYSLKRGDTKSCGCLRKKGKSNAIQQVSKKKTTRQYKTRNNQGGVYYFKPDDIQLKGNYEAEGNKRGGEVKEYKLNPTELAAYLEELKTKEVQRRK